MRAAPAGQDPDRTRTRTSRRTEEPAEPQRPKRTRVEPPSSGFQNTGRQEGETLTAKRHQPFAGQPQRENNVRQPRDGPAMDKTASAAEPSSPRGGRDHVDRTSLTNDENSEEDLYRGEEEIEEERKDRTRLGNQTTLTLSEEPCSVAAPVDILSYSQREWRGNTPKSVLIRKGYEAVAREFEGLRRVRGDNYCALRATLFQLLAQSHRLPTWMQNCDIKMWPSELKGPEKDLIGQWRFPFGGGRAAVEQMTHYLHLLKKRWEEVVHAADAEARESACQQVFRGQEEEYGLLEALKFLMLRTAAGLHAAMERGEDVPEFCCLLFARDSSRCPRSLFTNHLRLVGVEMFLLGYSLQQTIRVYRLYKSDSEEFVTLYPNDHARTWPTITLLTEDDRHYNVPVSSCTSGPSQYGTSTYL
ncbi:ubiquitin thioesterase otulin isoform X2 [Denticeps clupeoides]|uniref:ubiquitin thioesterase otulin isoform X2 n=1 Tax=Denticeps clupeoides TaxID=299321 RepID=UPI0010A56B28|nr:ubiquitin thioesterase otulin-like isoform X2 [Denticeps clupeoides]